MTVLFGENATGKSGYVRILKRLAAVRSAEEILPDIHATKMPGQPQATIEYTLGKLQDYHDWTGESGVRPFTRSSIFDSRAVALHVDDDLTYVYTPRDLALFKHAHEAIESVRDRLQQARDDTRPTTNPFLTRFEREATIYPKIETLGPSTDLADLDQLANVSDEEAANLPPLRSTVDALRPETIRSRLELSRSDQELFDDTHTTADAVATFDWQAYAQAVETLDQAEARLTTTTQTAFAGEGVPEVLSDAWKEFVQAGDVYSKHLGHHDYPQDNDKCVYCRQDLGKAAIGLLRKYHEYCNNTYRRERDEAKADLTTLSTPLTQLNPAQLKEAVTKKLAATGSAETPPPVLEKALKLAVDLEPLLSRVSDGLAAESSRALALASSC